MRLLPVLPKGVLCGEEALHPPDRQSLHVAQSRHPIAPIRATDNFPHNRRPETSWGSNPTHRSALRQRAENRHVLRKPHAINRIARCEKEDLWKDLLADNQQSPTGFRSYSRDPPFPSSKKVRDHWWLSWKEHHHNWPPPPFPMPQFHLPPE